MLCLNYNDYLLCKNKPSLENYLLCKLYFYGAALKFKARSNTLALNGRAHSWKPNIDRKLDSLSPIHKLIGRAMS